MRVEIEIPNFLYIRKNKIPVSSSTIKYLGEIGFLQYLHLPLRKI
jgi:hypothetical protein